MKTIILNRRRFTTGIHAINRILKISLAAENDIRIIIDASVFPAMFLIKISYHFHLYLSCPTNLRRSPACCSNFVRQSLSYKSHAAAVPGFHFCPTAPKKGGKLQLLTLPG
jgi:hypothetical protein